MNERDRFVRTEDLPEHGLHAGDLGTIVMVHVPDGDYTGPKGYTAEFTYLTGGTRAVVDLRPDQVRPAQEGAVRGEVERITQRLAGRVQELETRYADPLPELEDEVDALSETVDEHLKTMGVA
jgi:hypothetical protein